MPIRLLIVEDDPDNARSVREAAEGIGFDVCEAATGQEGVEKFRKDKPALVLTDLVLPDIDGLEVLSRVQQIDREVPVLVMTAYGTVESSVKALRAGAYDYVQKPLNLDDLESTLRRAAETSRLRARVDNLTSSMRDRYGARAMVAQSPATLKVIAKIEALADTMATVMIQGESGTGKELVARALHADSRRASGPFVAVNCGAFTESLLESELFGHEKGAFTGASGQSKGAFERADGGTLFLDEIGDMELASQAKILRVIQEGEFERVGSNQTHRIDARIIAATNQNLPEMVKKGSFREDLYYRLNVVPIQSPPLRERVCDIPLLINHFAHDLALELGTRIKVFGPSALQKMQQQSYPGNVRELKNIMERIYLLCDKEMLGAEDIQPLLPDAALTKDGVHFWEETVNFQDKKREFEIRYLSRQLERFGGNISQTAAALGLQQGNLSRKISELGLK